MRAYLVAAFAAVLSMNAASASAQDRYYMRELIPGLKKASSEQPPAGDQTPGTWTYGSYGPWSSNCSRNATRTRTASCTVDGKTVDDGRCTSPKETTVDNGTQTSGCTALIVNGTFDSGKTTPWTGGRLFGGSQNYGADGSSFIIGAAPNETVSQTVSGLDVGQSYALRFSCKDHNSYMNKAATSVGSTSAVIACSSGWAAKSLPFVATSPTMTVSFSNPMTTFLDLDSISISLQ